MTKVFWGRVLYWLTALAVIVTAAMFFNLATKEVVFNENPESVQTTR